MRASLFLAAAAAVSLLAGAAMAQGTPAQPNMSSTAGRDSTGSPQMTTSAGTAVQSGTASDAQPATSPPASGSMPSGSMPSSSGAMASGSSMPMASPTMTANSPTGDAPSTYPVCTKKGQDRCRSTGRRGK